MMPTRLDQECLVDALAHLRARTSRIWNHYRNDFERLVRVAEINAACPAWDPLVANCVRSIQANPSGVTRQKG